MSAFYDLASLVLVPSGYKTSKVYAQKPLTTDGQLAFTRSTTATRVASNGLIEKVRTNLMTYSEDWTNAAWTKTNATVTANATTNPINGATTADAIFETTDNGQHNFYQVFSATVGTEVTISFYAKANGRTKLRMNDGSSALTAAFDLTVVTASMLSGTGTPSITSVGSGWYRCSITFNALQTTEYVAMNFRDDANQDSYAGDITKGMYFFGGQAETGVTTAYIATTTAAVSVGPVANVPRLDYLNSSCPRLLLEPQRTNMLQYSEQMDNAYWLKDKCSITANQAVSPDGYTNADLLTMTSNGDGVIYRAGSASALSFFAKAATLSAGTKFYISVDGVGNAKWNQNGTISSQTGGLVAATDGVSYGNGWYRFTFAVGSGSVINFGLSGATSGDTAYIWGIQQENSATYATSYIGPTLGASVTRGADAASKTGISSLIGQTEGTIFWEGSGNATVGGADLWMAGISVDNTNVAVLLYYVASTGTVNAFINNGTTSVILNEPMTLTQVNKVAVAYKNASFALYLNGALVDSSSSAIAPPTGMNQFAFGKWLGAANQDRGLVNQALLFKTRLTNAQLAELTTI